MSDRFYTLAQAGGVLDVSHQTIRKFVEAGRLQIVRLKGRVLVTGDSLKALVEERGKPEPWKKPEESADAAEALLAS
jgi:predicted site-specific integrase-resolvase